MQQQSTGNKLFTLEGTDESGRPVYSPAPQVQQVCQVVDGFIYVANAEPGRGKITGTLVFSHFIGIPAAATGGCSVSSLLCYQHSTSASLCFTSQVMESLSWATYRLHSAAVAAQPPGLCWSSPASPGRTRQDKRKGVEHPASTWQRGSDSSSLPTPGW